MELDEVRPRAIELTLAFYAPNRIDATTLVANAEPFQWQSAVYRIDVVCSEQPVFVPYPSDFARAHRIWMSATGGEVRAESIYTTPNFDGTSAPADRRGLYPGHAAFTAQLDAIGAVLSRARTVAAEGLRIAVGNGIADLARYRAGITETAEGTYSVAIETRGLDRAAGAPPPFSFVRMTIDPARGRIEQVRVERYDPPRRT
jgi:hypothetical protein